MNCIKCNNYTKNNKFCSRSCATSYNNIVSPKRSLEGQCESCSTPIQKRLKFCLTCREENGFIYKTLSEVKRDGNSNYSSTYPYLRTHSRRTYIEAQKPMKCYICDYDLYVEICHIKDVNSYSLDTLIKDINDISNLIALCRNHHWEFDNGHLSL